MKKRNARPHGQLRRSQLITTFGPGAMLDLPNQSVLIGGLESWGDPSALGFQAIREDRLLEKLRTVLARPDVRMYAPPVDTSGDEPSTGITAWLFPEWFVAQDDEHWREGVRSRRLLHRRELVGGKYLAPDKKKHRVVPIRFVQACINGHISDVGWHGFVHEYKGECRRPLWFDERGTSGDLADVFIRCECSRARSLASATHKHEGEPALGFCNGNRPWLGPYARENCGGDDARAQPNRLLVRSASNSYFPQVLSVIAIPESDERLKRALDPVWEDFLQYVDDLADLQRERRKAKVAPAIQGFTDEAVLAEIKRRKSGAPKQERSIKQAEVETLLSPADVREPEFVTSRVKLDPQRSGFMSKVSRIVLVHKLREVTAQIGFTRFEASMPDIDGELSLEVRRAALARETSWVPAVENRGEGIFLAFDDAQLDAWVARPGVQKRMQSLRTGFDTWLGSHSKLKAEFPGPRYIMLHSLSHLLITSMSLACGYSASSIRERIYSTDSGCGILLYTGTPDAEGTLGGLVEAGKSIARHLRAALEAGMLCSNDPVCAHHRPESKHEERFLHGAACHGCLLIAEPSCERRNEYLDRSLVIPTVDSLGAEFFSEDDLL